MTNSMVFVKQVTVHVRKIAAPARTLDDILSGAPRITYACTHARSHARARAHTARFSGSSEERSTVVAWEKLSSTKLAAARSDVLTATKTELAAPHCL